MPPLGDDSVPTAFFEIPICFIKLPFLKAFFNCSSDLLGYTSLKHWFWCLVFDFSKRFRLLSMSHKEFLTSDMIFESVEKSN